MDNFSNSFDSKSDKNSVGNNINKLREYEKIDKIGAGTYSTVYKVRHKEKNIIFAMKIIEKKAGPEQEKQIKREIDNLIKCYHWEDNYNTLKLFDYFEIKEKYILVFNYCEKNLEEYVQENYENGIMPIDKIKLLFLDLNKGFNNLYKEKVIHRDIKINNIMIEYRLGDKDDIIPRLGDFGISRENSTENNPMTASISWLLLSAPEILENGTDYSFASDLWSIGVLLYKLAFGKYPYDGKGAVQLYMTIMTKPSKFEKSGNDDFDDLITKLLEKEKDKRITYDEYFNHPFFKYEEPISIIDFNKKYNMNISSYSREFRCSFYFGNALLKDLSEVEFNKLKELSLQHCSISDLTPLEHDVFKNLVFLNLQYNSIVDISPLKNIKFLEIKQIFLGFNMITDISPLKDIPFKCLEILSLPANKYEKNEANSRIIQSKIINPK
jgi:serine/threonine protein kinase